MTATRAHTIAAIGLTLVALAAAARAADEGRAETAARNKTLTDAERAAQPFVSYGCYQCHGYSGHGASSGPRLSADMPYEAFQQIVRFPYGVMPAYPRELLSDEKLRAIYSFVREQPPPPALEDVPLLHDASRESMKR